MSAETATRVADAALGRVASVVDGRRRVLDLDSLGRLGCLGVGTPERKYPALQRVMKPPLDSCRRPTASDLAADGSLGPDAYAFVDWLAAAGQTWWQMLPLGPPDRYGSPYKSASAFAGWPGLLADPRAPVSKSEELDFRERHAFWIDDWARLGPRGARRRPGALRPRVGGAARVRGRSAACG